HLLNNIIVSSAIQTSDATPASGFPGLEDDLVFSGAGSGCNNGDDEDECPPLPEHGSGDDDLITPVYDPPTRPPPTKKPKHKSDGGDDKGKPCDDEDCFPGSGSGEVTEETTMKVTTESVEGSSMTETSSPKHTVEEESTIPSHTTSGMVNLTTVTFKPTEHQDTTTEHQTTRIETTVAITTTEIHSSPTAPTTTTTEKEIPPHVIIPPQQENPYNYKPVPPKKPERVNSETSEIVALIIGIIAGALIAVVLIILVILKFKSRSDRSYKVEETKGYQQGPNAALLGNTSSSNGHHQAQYQLNGALRNGDKNGGQSAQMKAKKRDSKDIKEWYV
uniref:Neurexin-3-beta-like n=1 Tax=Diabrotica virgifera virgifera TaxID=50390 RepID=A0A6P7GQI9_DIAVI